MFKIQFINIKIIALLSFIVMMNACRDRDDFQSIPGSVRGFKPVYLDKNAKYEDSIYSTVSRALVTPGKIYVYQSFLLINELGKGIHIYDNSNPTTPLPVAFIVVPYNFDMAVKDNVLYADSYIGLVAIDINNLPDITVSKIIKYERNQKFPPLPVDFTWGGWGRSARTYFECIDENRGVVIDWEEVQLIEPKCYK
jgi:hypothetical protein